MPSIVESGQVSEAIRPSLPGERIRGVVGVLAVLAACAGAAWKVRALDRVETVDTLEAPPAARWSLRPDGQHELALAGVRSVPPEGALRVRACAAGTAPELWMELRAGAAMVARVRLSGEQTTSPRCAEARWATAGARRVSVALVAKSGAATLRSVTCRTGGVIRKVDLLPMLLLALGIGALILSPRRREDSGAAFAPTLPWPMRGVEGVVLVIVAFFGIHAAAQAPVLVWGFHGASMLASVLLQQLTLALAAAAMLGAFTAARPRVALELGPPEADWFRRALVAASLLVGFAMLVAVGLKDAGDAPIARVVDAMPTRYVIAFGALCAPLPEELFFRGVLGRMAEARVGVTAPLLPVALPALFFTAMHAMQLQGAWLGLLPIAAVGVVNGWIRWRTRGVVVPWAVHTLYNAALALSVIA
jgi:membrane protease YdiL (CAAX protease family)